MSSTLNVIAKSLAPALSVPEAKVSDWLQAFIYRACEELLLSGSVQISGIGALRRAHIPSRPLEQNGEILIAPPRYAVELLPESDDGNGGLLYDVAIETLGLDDDLAEKFSAGFAAAVQKTLGFKKRVELEQLGALALTDKGIEIEPSDWLLDLLNKPYQNLATIPLSEKSDVEAPQSKLAAAKVESSNAESYAENPAQLATASSGATLNPTPPTTSKIQRAEFNPADFGLDSAPANKQDENKIFTEQSGLLAELDAKRGRTEKKKTPFQPPIPPSPEEFEATLASSPKTPTRIALENEDIPSVEKAKTGTEEAEVAEPALKAPKDGISKGAIFTLIGVGIAVVAIIITFFFVSRNLRTFPASSPAAMGTAPAVAKSEPEKSSSQHASEKPKATKGAESDKSASKHSEGAEHLAAKKPDATPNGNASTTTSPSADKSEKPSVEPPKSGAAQSALPPELSTPVNEAKGGWTIVVASRPTEAEAKEVANAFAQKGFSVSIKPRTVNGEMRYRVRIGQFAQQNDALKAIKQYAAQLPKGAFLDKIQ